MHSAGSSETRGLSPVVPVLVAYGAQRVRTMEMVPSWVLRCSVNSYPWLSAVSWIDVSAYCTCVRRKKLVRAWREFCGGELVLVFGPTFASEGAPGLAPDFLREHTDTK